jgi:DNA polymerase-3 subunit delta
MAGMAVTLIQGGEELLAERAISLITAQAPESSVTTLHSELIEVGAITDALAPSLFGDSRIVVIKEIQDLVAEVSEEIATYLQNPDDSVHLIMWHKGGVKGKALLERIKKEAPKIIEVEIIKKESQKTDFVLAEFSRLGRKISLDAVQAIVDSVGSDIRELAGVCTQLASDVISGKSIGREDVEKFQQGRIEMSGYDVADAIMDGKTDVALITLRQALESGVDPVLVVSAISSAVRNLAKVSGVSRGVKSFDLAASLALPPWQIDKAQRQLTGWTPGGLSMAVITLAQADADIKGAVADPTYALERCVIAISRCRARENSV